MAKIDKAVDESGYSSRVQKTLDVGVLVPRIFNSIDLTYVASGNGAGKIETATYKQDGDDVAVLTLAYNSDDKIESVTRT